MNGKRVLKTNRKAPVALVAILVLLCCAVAGTVAFLIDSTGPVTNTFTPASVTTQVEEEFNGTTKSDVKIKNTGNTDAFIRAAIVVNWADQDGNVYPVGPAAGTDYSIGIGTGWTARNDGYYYYNTSVAETASTTVLINTCEPTGVCPGGEQYKLQVTILADAIQSSPASAAQEAWGYVPGQTAGN